MKPSSLFLLFIYEKLSPTATIKECAAVALEIVYLVSDWLKFEFFIICNSFFSYCLNCFFLYMSSFDCFILNIYNNMGHSSRESDLMRTNSWWFLYFFIIFKLTHVESFAFFARIIEDQYWLFKVLGKC